MLQKIAIYFLLLNILFLQNFSANNRREIDNDILSPENVQKWKESKSSGKQSVIVVKKSYPALKVDFVRRKEFLPLLSMLCLVSFLVTLFNLKHWSRWTLSLTYLGAAYFLLPFTILQIPIWGQMADKPNEEQSRKLVGLILSKIYQASDSKTEKTVYDSLNKVVKGPLLENIYLEINDNLKRRKAKESSSARQEVDLQNITLTDSLNNRPEFNCICTWVVNGIIRHEGHEHYQSILNSALLKIEVHEGYWKVSIIDATAQKGFDK